MRNKCCAVATLRLQAHHSALINVWIRTLEFKFRRCIQSWVGADGCCWPAENLIQPNSNSILGDFSDEQLICFTMADVRSTPSLFSFHGSSVCDVIRASVQVTVTPVAHQLRNEKSKPSCPPELKQKTGGGKGSWNRSGSPPLLNKSRNRIMLLKLGEEEDSDASGRRYLCDLLVCRILLWMQPPEPKPRPPIMIERELKPPIRHQQWNRPIYITKWEAEHKLNISKKQ